MKGYSFSIEIQSWMVKKENKIIYKNNNGAGAQGKYPIEVPNSSEIEEFLNTWL